MFLTNYIVSNHMSFYILKNSVVILLTNTIYNTTKNNNLIANSLIDEIRDVLASFKKRKESIFDYFGGFTKEQVIRTIMELPDSYKVIIFKKYGQNLNTVNLIDKLMQEKLDDVIVPTMLYDLKHKTYTNNILTILNCSNTEILRNNLLKLSENRRNLVIKRFNKNYDNSLSLEELIRLYLEILPELRVMIKNDELLLNKSKTVIKKEPPLVVPKESEVKNTKPIKRKKVEADDEEQTNVKNLFEVLSDYSKEEILMAVNKLEITDIKILQKRYGINFDEYHNLTQREAAHLKQYTMPSIILNLNPGAVEKMIRKMFFGRSLDDIKEAILKLPTKQRRLAIFKFGENLDTIKRFNDDIEEVYFNKTVVANINKILNGEKLNFNPYYNLTLLEQLSDFDKEEIIKVINELDEFSKTVINVKFGYSLDEINTVPKRVDQKLGKIIEKLKIILEKNRKKMPTIYEKLHLDKEIVDKRIANLNREEKEALFVYYGYDLDNPTKKIFDKKLISYVEKEIIPKLNKPLESELILVKSLTDIISDIQNKGLLLEFNQSEILSVYLAGRINSGDYTMKYILNLLDINVEIFNANIKEATKKNSMAFKMINNLVSAYIAEYMNENKNLNNNFIL